MSITKKSFHSKFSISVVKIDVKVKKAQFVFKSVVSSKKCDLWSLISHNICDIAWKVALNLTQSSSSW